MEGEALSVLKTLPQESIDCVVTSPPYWSLRDYGVAGQLGLEQSYEEYLQKLCAIFDEIQRVLMRHGTCWVNMGDSYGGSCQNYGARNQQQSKNTRSLNQTGNVAPILPPAARLQAKCLLQIPSRFSIEMCRRGWILRNEIIWRKPNSMPSSVKDRFTVDFEKLFFFTKHRSYWFDVDAVREPHGRDQRMAGMQRARQYGYDGKGSYRDWYFHQRQGKDWVNKKETGDHLTYGQAKRNNTDAPPVLIHPLGRNKRCVWSVPTRPFKEAHFATYPEKLIETPIRAGCPEGGIVLDPFLGSGTTAVVAKKLRRHYLGIELNPAYIEIARTRLARALSENNDAAESREIGRPESRGAQ